MSDLLEWLGEYSPSVVALLALAAAAIFIAKLVVEKAVATQFDQKTKVFESLIQRRSTFEEKVLTERFEMVSSIYGRLQRFLTAVNRIRSGQPAPEGFLVENEPVQLTEVFEDIQIGRLVLGEDFRSHLDAMAQVVLAAVNAPNAERWEWSMKEWYRLSKDLDSLVERDFGLASIRW